MCRVSCVDDTEISADPRVPVKRTPRLPEGGGFHLSKKECQGTSLELHFNFSRFYSLYFSGSF